MAKVIFSHGTQAQYDALPNKNIDTVYVITDSRRIYKGDRKVADVSVNVVDSVPEYASALEDVLYVVISANDIGLYVKDATSASVKQVGGGQIKDSSITSINMFDESLIFKTTKVDENGEDQMLSLDDDSTIPTSGAVAKAIKTELADYVGSAFVDVEVSRVDADDLNPSAGTVLKFKHADGIGTSEVRIADLFLTNAKYDSNTHILELSVQGQDKPVEVDLGELIPQAVSTADVAMSRNIVATVDVGNIKKGQTIDISKVKDLQTLLETMLSQDSLPTVTQPSVTLTTPNNKEYEVGAKVVPAFSASFSAGSYSQTAAKDQVASGVTVEDWTVKCTGQEDKTFGAVSSIEGEFDEITVEDGTDVAVTVTANHTAGATPKSYLGNSEVDGVATSTKAIAKGSKSDNNNTHITSFRNCFWGYKKAGSLIEDPANITVEEIKNLGNVSKNRPASLSATGMQQMFFAVPASQANKLTIVGANPPAPQTVLGPIEIQIGGVDNYSPIAYNMFYVSNAQAASGADTYALTWAKE